jgi:ABC-type Fe3+-siderophore transport system permease subunit
MTTARRLGLLLLLGLALFAFAVSIAVGSVRLPIDTVLLTLFGRGSALERAIVMDLRLPRSLLAALTGGSLAISGAAFQALLRNPLAEPYVLGISGGAAVGAVGAIVLGFGATAPALIPFAALFGAVAAILLVLRIALRGGAGLDTRVLLLAGVIAGAFFNALILLLLTYADIESFRSAVFWIMGSLVRANWRDTSLLALYAIPAGIVLIALARPFNLLAAGDETALYLGIPVTRMKTFAYLVGSFLVAVSVAACGVIGFIGLVVPHAVRLAWGGEHRFLLPASFLAGAAFLLIADTAARTVAAPAELPVGVLTALIGVPIFLVLLRRSSP